MVNDSAVEAHPAIPVQEIPERVPRHVGVVLDGNRRWARGRGLPSAREGHRCGFAKIPELLDWCECLGIEVVTVWMLSDDNIRNRSAAELDDLYAIDGDIVTELVAIRRWRLHPIGCAELLPGWLADRLRHAEEATSGLGGMLVNLALGYGGRSDLVRAVRGLLQDIVAGEETAVTEDTLAGYLSTAGQPDPDLIIRPAGELRTSGFLLWQAALAELYFSDRLWPDFDRADLLAAAHAYSRRQRRLGA